MGFAQIVSGGPNGRYTVLLDWGQSTKDTVLAALSVHQTSISVQIGQAEAAVEAGRVAITELNERIALEIADIIARQNTLPPGTPEGRDDRELRPLLDQVRARQVQNAPLLFNLSRLKFERVKVAKQIAYWNNFSAQETRQAWCVDYTEDKAAGTYVATMDIPGEPSLIVLAPGARAPSDADGQLVAREMMAPWQAYFNAAIQPGWAKHLPTARWGTITGINYPAATATVVLADAYLSGQRLSVNQTSTLTDVPVEYMTCQAGPFELGDRVVVEFQGQSWDAPRVVGFVDNPRPCNWVCRGSAGITAIFASLIPSVMSSISGTGIDIRGRLNRGSWYPLEYKATSSTSDYNWFESPNEANVGGGFREYEVLVYPVSYPGTPIFPCIMCNCKPPAAAASSSDLSLRHIAEIAIYVDGEIVFNAAFTDGGFAASTQRGDGIYVKSSGGIQLGYPNAYTIDVKRMSEFTDYTLISEEP